MPKEIKAGYHIKEIQKGVLGEYSKIIEEFEEYNDALEQNCKIMQLVELSDLIGALEHYSVYNKILTSDNFKNLLLTLIHSQVEVEFSTTESLSSIINQKPDDSHPIHVENWITKILLNIHSLLAIKYKGFDLDDVYKMSKITQRAFINERR